MKPKFSVYLISLLVAYAGLINILSPFIRKAQFRYSLLNKLIPFEAQFSSRSLTVLSGFILIYLAYHLWYRKRAAWRITIFILSVSTALHLFKGLDIEEASISLILVALIYLNKNNFYAKNDPITSKSGWRVLLYTIIFLILYGTVGFWVFRYQFQQHVSLIDDLSEVFKLVTWQQGFYEPSTRRAHSFIMSIQIISIFGLLSSIVLWFRPLLMRNRPTASERNLVRNIVNNHGDTGISYYALSQDKFYYFNKNMTSVIPFVVQRNVAISCGSPIGEKKLANKLLSSFIEYTDQYSWEPVFYQVNKNTSDFLSQKGFKSISIGKEAFINLNDFTFSGKSKNDLRTVLNKESQNEWSFLMQSNLDDTYILDQCDEISERWLQSKFGGEMGFSMGGSTVRGDGMTLTSVMLDKDKKVLAFATWVPMNGRNGWALDLMRRNIDTPNGTMEYIISKSILYFKENGYSFISLSLSPFSHIEESNSQEFTKMLQKIISRFYNTSGLYRFKNKFDPEWEERYLVYRSNLVLPRILTALIKVHMPSLSILEIRKLIHLKI